MSLGTFVPFCWIIQSSCQADFILVRMKTDTSCWLASSFEAQWWQRYAVGSALKPSERLADCGESEGSSTHSAVGVNTFSHQVSLFLHSEKVCEGFFALRFVETFQGKHEPTMTDRDEKQHSSKCLPSVCRPAFSSWSRIRLLSTWNQEMFFCSSYQPFNARFESIKELKHVLSFNVESFH